MTQRGIPTIQDLKQKSLSGPEIRDTKVPLQNEKNLTHSIIVRSCEGVFPCLFLLCRSLTK